MHIHACHPNGRPSFAYRAAPAWLFQRMVQLAHAMATIIVADQGPLELMRLSDGALRLPDSWRIFPDFFLIYHLQFWNRHGL